MKYKPTTKLTLAEYPHFTDKNSALMKQVNLESEKMYQRETPPTPAYKETEVEPFSAGIYNLVKMMLP